jgi:hypothetical protein
MVNLSAEKTGDKPLEPEVIIHEPTVGASAPVKSAVSFPTAPERPKITLQSARQGIILSEILGEPLSKRRRHGRWR